MHNLKLALAHFAAMAEPRNPSTPNISDMAATPKLSHVLHKFKHINSTSTKGADTPQYSPQCMQAGSTASPLSKPLYSIRRHCEQVGVSRCTYSVSPKPYTSVFNTLVMYTL